MRSVINLLSTAEEKFSKNKLSDMTFEEWGALLGFCRWMWEMALTEASAKDSIRATLILAQMGRKDAFALPAQGTENAK